MRPMEEIEAENHHAWQQWLAGLTPDELVALEKAGVTPPEPPRRVKRARRQTEDDEPGLGTCDHLPSEDADPFEALAEKEERQEREKPGTAAAFEIDETTRRDLAVLTYVLPAIIDADNPRLVASLLALALRIGKRQKISYEGLREKHNCGVSWMQRKVREWERAFDISRTSVAMLRLVVSPILASRNPRLEADCISMAASFGLSGGASMTQRGEHHGVCKAAISARVRSWCARFHIPLPRDCKEATENYVLFNVRREKPKPITE